jgi:threonine/homoserine efflux transporter RhtA
MEHVAPARWARANPAIAALVGVLWLGQRLGAFEVIGIGLVVLASGGAMATRRSL